MSAHPELIERVSVAIEQAARQEGSGGVSYDDLALAAIDAVVEFVKKTLTRISA